MQSKLFAVIVEHTEADCPLRQADAVAAEILADNLDQAQATGVFSMLLHHGVALATADDEAGLITAFRQVAPKHDVQVKEVPAELAGALRAYLQAPGRLEEEGERHTLLRLADRLFPGRGLTRTEAERLPSRSLRALPAFLRDNAPVQSPAA
jgi:hypothetical protein